MYKSSPNICKSSTKTMQVIDQKFKSSAKTKQVIDLKYSNHLPKSKVIDMLTTKTWCNYHGEDLAMLKAELLLIIGRHIPLLVDMTIGNELIRNKSSVRYLGIRLDSSAD